MQLVLTCGRCSESMLRVCWAHLGFRFLETLPPLWRSCRFVGGERDVQCIDEHIDNMKHTFQILISFTRHCCNLWSVAIQLTWYLISLPAPTPAAANMYTLLKIPFWICGDEALLFVCPIYKRVRPFKIEITACTSKQTLLVLPCTEWW